MIASRALSLAQTALIERVDDLVVGDPAKLAGMGALVAVEEEIAGGVGEGANRYAVALGEEADLSIVGVAGALGNTPVLIVGTFHWHAQHERLGPKLAQATEQQLKVGPVGVLLDAP